MVNCSVPGKATFSFLVNAHVFDICVEFSGTAFFYNKYTTHMTLCVGISSYNPKYLDNFVTIVFLYVIIYDNSKA